ncbi:MAG: polysaccharide pyruvyl transferase family protein [Candidatus Omnitrophica bacterium]|nr:polysaccharide pyruvyl transferase family protein [Candidatus Omnitrophota bacterium]
MSTDLYELLKVYKDKKFVLVEPGGNAGDLLIYKGFHKLIHLAGIDYTTVTHDEYMKAAYSPDTVVYLHGGGGYIPVWSGTPALALQKSLSQHKGVVINGPTTIVDDSEYISKTFLPCFKSNVTSRFVLYTREKTSYFLIKDLLPAFVDLRVDHDTALNLTKEDVLNKEIKGKYRLFAIRNDKEMPQSLPYDYLNWMDPVLVTKSFDEWVSIHAHARELFTNRTHSTILGSILQIPTKMMANGYHKNRSIWEYSLKDRGVVWLDELPCGMINKVIESRGRLKKFFTSSKYRSFRKNLLVNYSM